MTLEKSLSQSNISQEEIQTIVALDDKEILRAMRRIELTKDINAINMKNKIITERNNAITEKNKALGSEDDADELEELEEFTDSGMWDGEGGDEEDETSDPETRDYFVSAPASEIIDNADEAGLDILTKAIKSERKKRIETETSTNISGVLNK